MIFNKFKNIKKVDDITDKNKIKDVPEKDIEDTLNDLNILYNGFVDIGNTVKDNRLIDDLNVGSKKIESRFVSTIMKKINKAVKTKEDIIRDETNKIKKDISDEINKVLDSNKKTLKFPEADKLKRIQREISLKKLARYAHLSLALRGRHLQSYI